MKRSFLILLAGVIGIILIFIFRPKQPVVNEPITTAIPTPTNTTIALEAKNVPTETITQVPPPQVVVTAKPKNPLDALAAQNLADWTNAIPKIKQWTHFRNFSSWVAAPMDTNNYPIILLTGINGSKIQFTASLTSVSAMGDHVQEIELHTPDMNIDETREFGESLLQMMGKDKTGFDAWCDKVGNNWVDAPLYDSYNARLPNSSEVYSFATHRTFGNEKPWYILFVITGQ